MGDISTEIVIAVAVGSVGIAFTVLKRKVHKKLNDKESIEAPSRPVSVESNVMSSIKTLSTVTVNVTGSNNDVDVSKKLSPYINIFDVLGSNNDVEY